MASIVEVVILSIQFLVYMAFFRLRIHRVAFYSIRVVSSTRGGI